MTRHSLSAGFCAACLLIVSSIALPALAGADEKASAEKAASSAAKEVPSAKTAAAQGSAATANARASGMTGPMSEEEFKALHELKTESAPPPRGKLVEIADSYAYLSLPPNAKAPIPGVIVIHEWWGPNEHVMHWADRLADEGYAALAVDLYNGKVATTPDSAMSYMKQVDEAASIKILKAAHEFLTKDERIKAPRTASIGWCFGGGWSLQTALAVPELDAAVIYYGHPVTDPEELRAIKASVFGVFGTQDQSIPPATVKDFDKALTTAGVEHEIHSYDAVHAFANPSNPKYDQKSAADAWAKVSKFLRAKLKG